MGSMESIKYAEAKSNASLGNLSLMCLHRLQQKAALTTSMPCDAALNQGHIPF